MLTPENKANRPYLQRLATDARMHRLLDGWTAQATLEAEGRYPEPWQDRERTHYAAKSAAALAMAFVLDNDREYQMVCEERDRALEMALQANGAFVRIPRLVDADLANAPEPKPKD